MVSIMSGSVLFVVPTPVAHNSAVLCYDCCRHGFSTTTPAHQMRQCCPHSLSHKLAPTSVVAVIHTAEEDTSSGYSNDDYGSCGIVGMSFCPLSVIGEGTNSESDDFGLRDADHFLEFDWYFPSI